MLDIINSTDMPYAYRRAAAAGYPPLPHLVRGGSAIQVGVVFDREKVQPLLPAGAELTDEATGGFMILDCPDGWGITPYRHCQIWVDIKHLDSDTGRRCRFSSFGFIQGELAARFFAHAAVPGAVGITEAGEERWTGEGGPDGAPVVRVRVGKPVKPPILAAADHYNYLQHESGTGVFVCALSSLADRTFRTPLAVDLDPSIEQLRPFEPVALRWAMTSVNISFTCGTWLPMEEALPIRLGHQRSLLLSFLGRFGRAAVLVEPGGRVVLMNGRAERLVGSGLRIAEGRLGCSLRRNQVTLDRAIGAVSSGAGGPVTIALDRREGAPVIARVTPFEPEHRANHGAAPRLALIVLADPGQSLEDDPVPGLMCLGLTPAEARVASKIGAGRSPRQAARDLGHAESSVRTTLKRIYSKLDLSRQAELALLVSRISAIGA